MKTIPIKPTPEQFGYHSKNTFDGDRSGWQFEGGEEAYNEELERYEFMIKNGLCEEDMIKDTQLPDEI